MPHEDSLLIFPVMFAGLGICISQQRGKIPPLQKKWFPGYETRLHLVVVSKESSLDFHYSQIHSNQEW